MALSTTIIKILRSANINTSRYRLSRERRDYYFKLIEEALANGISFYGEMTKYLCQKTGLSEVRARQIKNMWFDRDPKRARELIRMQKQMKKQQEQTETQTEPTTTEPTTTSTSEAQTSTTAR
jgi:hypothetical protein